MATSWLEPVDATSSASPTPSASSTASTVSTSPVPEPAGGASDGGAATPWLGWATLGAALIAAVVALYAATLQRKSSKEAVRAADKSATAAENSSQASHRSAKAAEETVTLNTETAHATAVRLRAEGYAERFQDAASQLGNTNAAVRLAGVHSMARLADDWDEQRQTCVDVLCAYMRMSFQEGVSQVGSQEDEVRASIVKSIAQRMVPGQEFTWVDMRIDLSGSVIKGCDFSGAVFMYEPNFDDVRFEGYNTFDGAMFPEGGSFRHIRQVGEDVESVKAPRAAYLSFESVSCGGVLDFGSAVIEPFSHLYVEPARHGLRDDFDLSRSQIGGTVILTLTAQTDEKQISLFGATMHDDATLRVQIAGDDRDSDEALASVNLRGIDTQSYQTIRMEQSAIKRASVRWSEGLSQAKDWRDD